MEPIRFPGYNVVFAEDQPEYEQLPARRTPDGIVVSCWKLTWLERLSMLFRGRFYIAVITNGAPQPIKPTLTLEDVYR